MATRTTSPASWTSPPKPADEADRLVRLHQLNVLDSPPEAEFDQIVALASKVCGTTVSLVSLIDADRQWFKARLGLDLQETSRDLSFCAYAILGKDLLVVPDATRDERFAENPLVTGPAGVRFYAGAPLVTSDGFALGTLCVVDGEPHRLSFDQLQALRALARQVTAQLELRHFAAVFNQVSHSRAEADRRVDELVTLVDAQLRGPLTDVRAYLDHLAAGGELEPEVAARAATAVQDHAVGLRTLVDDVLAVVGVDDGATLRMRRLDLSRLTTRAVEAVRPIAHAKGIWIVHQSGPELPVLVDPIRLEQALGHLLFAAVKYTPDGGRIQVATGAESGPAVRIEDLDAPDGAHPHLFEHLHRVISRGEDPEGTDRGLTVTKQILDIHHATLTMSDRPGEGTSLHVVFPAAPELVS
ncbi:GAF domain-containing sensor histidine kinase [Pilimelia columellifera subsp. columellifera]|uniref:histidine kinase n=2 Tax=Pilimelia TaxID=53370 RepID=A0ABN3N7T7_9ACTN